MAKEALLALVDPTVDDSDIVIGWSVPKNRIGDFIAALDEAAWFCGALRFSELMLHDDSVTPSEANDLWLDSRSRMIIEAESALWGDSPEP